MFGKTGMWLGWLVCVAITLTACEPGRRPVTVSDEDDGIRFTLWSPYSQYHKGETLQIKITLENISDHSITLTNNDEPVFDIGYRNATYTDTLWSIEYPDLVTNELTLAPGEKFETEISFVPSQERVYHFSAMWWSRQGTSGRGLVLSVVYGVVAL